MKRPRLLADAAGAAGVDHVGQAWLGLSNVQRYAIYGALLLALLGVLLILFFKVTIAASNAPTDLNSSNYAKHVRDYTERLEWFRAMVDVGTAMIASATALALLAIALAIGLPKAPSAAPTSSTRPVEPTRSATPPAPAPEVTPATRLSTRDILRKLKT